MISPQDLHIHTVFSTGDSAVMPEQTVELIASVRHAEIIGVSDHFEYIRDDCFERYRAAVTSFGFKLGTEVAGGDYADEAAGYPVDYYRADRKTYLLMQAAENKSIHDGGFSHLAMSK